MKIGGPKGPPDTGPISQEGTANGKKVDAPDFGKLLDNEATATAGVQQLEQVAEISARLKAKEITGEQAVELLIEAVVQQKMKDLSPALKERLLFALRQLVADDPLLAEKARLLAGDDP